MMELLSRDESGPAGGMGVDPMLLEALIQPPAPTSEFVGSVEQIMGPATQQYTLSALGPSRGFNGSSLDLDFPSGGPDCALRPSSHTLTSTQSNQACLDGPPGGQSRVNCGCC